MPKVTLNLCVSVMSVRTLSCNICNLIEYDQDSELYAKESCILVCMIIVFDIFHFFCSCQRFLSMRKMWRHSPSKWWTILASWTRFSILGPRATSYHKTSSSPSWRTRLAGPWRGSVFLNKSFSSKYKVWLAWVYACNYLSMMHLYCRGSSSVKCSPVSLPLCACQGRPHQLWDWSVGWRGGDTAVSWCEVQDSGRATWSISVMSIMHSSLIEYVSLCWW